jgi:hypothetical protein
VTKQAANVISFSGAIDTTKNQYALLSMTSVCYRVSNKNGVIYVEGLTPDFPDYLLRTEIEIGTWDMDTDETKAIPLVMDAAKIRSMQVWIVSDGGTYAAPINGYGWNTTSFVGEGMHGGVAYFRDNSDSITLWRRDTGFFDDFIFSGSANRGWITIEHTP